nr:hypothetical protein [Tanacetum cinerariifolium]
MIRANSSAGATWGITIASSGNVLEHFIPNRDRSDDEDRYRRKRDVDRYRSGRGGQDRRISNRSDEEDKDGRRDSYRNMDRDRMTDDRRRDISRDDSRRRDKNRSRSVSSAEEGANENRRDKSKDKGTDGEDDMRCGICHLRYRFHGYSGEINPIGGGYGRVDHVSLSRNTVTRRMMYDCFVAYCRWPIQTVA